MNIFEALGLDERSFVWQDLAQCKGKDTELFFDKYESSPRTARAVDDMCFSCPVQKVCLQEGVDKGATGVWGGVYLINGRQDESKNSHKSKETWIKLTELIT